MTGNWTAPQPAQHDAGDAERNQPDHLLLVRQGLVSQEQAGKHPQQARHHRRDRAQEPFRVEERVVLARGQILEVNVVGQVEARVELASDPVGRRIEHLLRRRPRRAVLDRRGVALLLEERGGLRIARLLGELREVALGQLDVANRHERHQRPVAGEDADADRDECPRLEEAKQQPGKEIRQRNPVEHAHQPDVRPRIGEAARVEDADDETAECSVGRPASAPPPAPPAGWSSSVKTPATRRQ